MNTCEFSRPADELFALLGLSHGVRAMPDPRHRPCALIPESGACVVVAAS